MSHTPASCSTPNLSSFQTCRGSSPPRGPSPSSSHSALALVPVGLGVGEGMQENGRMESVGGEEQPRRENSRMSQANSGISEDLPEADVLRWEEIKGEGRAEGCCSVGGQRVLLRPITP